VAELPNIRYFDPSNAKVNKAYKLANYLQEEMDELIRNDPEFPHKDNPANTQKKGTLIIVERSFDMATPLLHEFTYQAMVHDLVSVQGGKLR
jgi:syntaxin-binding protein 1